MAEGVGMRMANLVVIEAKVSSPEVDDCRRLFEEYAASLSVDLCFQSFAAEVSSLPGDYAPPGGCLLLAMAGGEPAGCVALRRWKEGVCEMKRLYVRPSYRGTGLGRELVERILSKSKSLGYSHMRLDTLPEMTAAISLYRSVGFREIGSYRHNPVPGHFQMELDLRTDAMG